MHRYLVRGVMAVVDRSHTSSPTTSSRPSSSTGSPTESHDSPVQLPAMAEKDA